jgi:ATP/maltotriose-dependent transcriptional regulator MalT
MRWLEAFPNDVKLADPDLSSITAFCLARQGRIAEVPPFLEAAEVLWEKAKNNNGLAVVEIIRGEVARMREEGGKLIEHAARCLTLAGCKQDAVAAAGATVGVCHVRLTGTWMEASPHIIPFIQLALGLTLSGRITEGVRLAEELLEFRKADDVDREIRTVLAQVGHAYVAAGRFAEAETILERVAHDGLDEILTDATLVVGSLSKIMYSQNRINECEQLLQEGIRLLTQRRMQSLDAPLQLQLARVRWAKGDLHGTLESLDAATESANSLQNARQLNEVYAFLARIALAGGDVESARRWALMPRLAADPPAGSMSLPDSLILARIHIAEGDVEAAVELLERLRRTLAASGARYNLLHVLALLSLAYLDLFELEQAIQVLHDALVIGEAAHHVRVFIDDGSPMSRLLRIAHRRGVQVYYVNTLLKASGETPEKLTKFTHIDLIEPITAREIDVLELLALSLTNKEISEELFIALSTVKRHITNLYGKLGVSSRTEAVQKARKLNLLASKQESSAQTTAVSD